MLIRVAYSPLTLGRPVGLPPDVPADRVAAMCKAFLDMLGDREFRAEATQVGLQFETPRTGVQLQEELARIYACRLPCSTG